MVVRVVRPIRPSPLVRTGRSMAQLRAVRLLVVRLARSVASPDRPMRPPDEDE
jgi:hypothetical protein